MAFYRLPVDVSLIGDNYAPLGGITANSPYQKVVEWYECNLHNASDEVGVDILRVSFDTSSENLIIDFSLKPGAAKPDVVYEKLANPGKEYIKIDNFEYLVTGDPQMYLVECHKDGKVAWPFTY